MAQGGGPEKAWWNLPPGLKRILQKERLAGRYGGESGVGAGKAPYFWAQERGKDSASITGQWFALESWLALRNKGQKLLSYNLRQILSGK